MHVYEVRPRIDKRGVDLISDALPFGRVEPSMLLLPSAFAALDAGLLLRPFVEYGAHSLAIEPQTEPVFRRKLGDLVFSSFLVYRPNAFQVLLVNQAVLPYAMHPFFDLFR